MPTRLLLCAFLSMPWAAHPAAADEPRAEGQALPALAVEFLKTHCGKCHSGERPKGKLDLAQFQTQESLKAEAKRWEKIIARVHAGEMPPEGSPQPEELARTQFVKETKAALYAAICDGGAAPGPAPIRRLNRTEYGATIRDLLGVQVNLGQMLPDEGAGGEGFDNAAETQSLSPLHAEKYLEAAKEALVYASKDRRSRGALLYGRSAEERRGFGRRDETPPDPDPPLTAESAKQIIERILPRAFRRPAREGEVDQYFALFQAAQERGEPVEQSILFALQGILISPHFLFRLEETNHDPKPRLVGHYEIASRLSYFLWASLPDEELLRLAGEGKLNEEQVLREQSARMLKDRKTRESVESFVEQWLGTRELGRTIKPERTGGRGGYTNELEWALKQEPVLFFQYILAENRPLLDLLDSNYTFLDTKLARHYGVRVTGVELKQQLLKIDLPEGSHRGGLLGMGGVLTVSSLPHRTSPVLRGKWVKEALLGSPPPPPPLDVPPLNDKQTGESPATIRERLELHRQNPTCASCHNHIDPIGFGLENYDLLGRWRDDEVGRPIDAKGELPDGTKFDGPQQLKQVLLQRKDDIIRHLTTKMLGYAVGRGLSTEDHCTVEEIVKKVREGEYRSHVLIAEIVCSVPFRYRVN